MEKLLAVASLGEKFYGKWFFHRFVSGFLLLLGLTIITAILCAILLLCIVYAAHLVFVSQGLGMLITLGVPLLLGIAIVVIILCIIRRQLRETNQLPQDIMKQTIAIAKTFPAFWAGLTETPKE